MIGAGSAAPSNAAGRIAPAARCAAIRPRPPLAPPEIANQLASASAVVTASPRATERPSLSPSARTSSPPDRSRSIRTSAESPASTREVPSSMAKPNLVGSSSLLSASASSSSAASDCVVSPARQNGVTRMLRRDSVSESGSSSASSERPSSSSLWLVSLTPLIWRLARLVTSIRPLPWRSARRASPEICAASSRPPNGRTRTTSPSPDCIGRSAPGHQPLTTEALMTPPAAQPRSNCGAFARARPHAGA
ncbi:hypothetical protein ACVWZZ_007484 [Bradyrhizobium sp. LM6.10]